MSYYSLGRIINTDVSLKRVGVPGTDLQRVQDVKVEVMV